VRFSVGERTLCVRLRDISGEIYVVPSVATNMPFGLFSIASQSPSIGLTMRFAARLHGGIANVIPTSPFRAFFRCINGERLCGHIAALL